MNGTITKFLVIKKLRTPIFEKLLLALKTVEFFRVTSRFFNYYNTQHITHNKSNSVWPKSVLAKVGFGQSRFGQSWFGQSRFGNDGQSRFGQSRFRPVHPGREDDASSSQSSSVGHKTGRPVVGQFDSQISNVRENPRHSSGSEQIRILLERQGEQTLADCQAEIRKHEFQADYDRRSIQKLNEMIESGKKKKFVVLIKETNDVDKLTNYSRTVVEAKLGSSSSSWKMPHCNGRIEAISRLNFRHKEKIGRRSRYYPWTHWQDTGITEWN